MLLAPDDWTTPPTIEMRILNGDGAVAFFGETSTARIRRTILELTEWLTRDNRVPAGTVLLTGTGLVPDGLSLAGGQTVEIRVEGIGTLSNPVARR